MCGTWFGKFMRWFKLQLGVIKKQELVVTSNMFKALLVGFDTKWNR